MTHEICPDGSRQTENQLVDLARRARRSGFYKNSWIASFGSHVTRLLKARLPGSK